MIIKYFLIKKYVAFIDKILKKGWGISEGQVTHQPTRKDQTGVELMVGWVGGCLVLSQLVVTRAHSNFNITEGEREKLKIVMQCSALFV